MPVCVLIRVEKPLPSSCLSSAHEVILLKGIVDLAEPLENTRPFLIVFPSVQSIDALSCLQDSLTGEISRLCRSAAEESVLP